MTKLIDPIKCFKCGEMYGKTNLLYQDIELWQTCKCGMSDDRVMLINTAHLITKKPELTELEKAANEFLSCEDYTCYAQQQEAFIAGAKWLADKLIEHYSQEESAIECTYLMSVIKDLIKTEGA